MVQTQEERLEKKRECQQRLRDKLAAKEEENQRLEAERERLEAERERLAAEKKKQKKLENERAYAKKKMKLQAAAMSESTPKPVETPNGQTFCVARTPISSMSDQQWEANLQQWDASLQREHDMKIQTVAANKSIAAQALSGNMKMFEDTAAKESAFRQHIMAGQWQGLLPATRAELAPLGGESGMFAAKWAREENGSVHRWRAQIHIS